MTPCRVRVTRNELWINFTVTLRLTIWITSSGSFLKKSLEWMAKQVSYCFHSQRNNDQNNKQMNKQRNPLVLTGINKPPEFVDWRPEPSLFPSPSLLENMNPTIYSSLDSYTFYTNIEVHIYYSLIRNPLPDYSNRIPLFFSHKWISTLSFSLKKIYMIKKYKK